MLLKSGWSYMRQYMFTYPQPTRKGDMLDVCPTKGYDDCHDDDDDDDATRTSLLRGKDERAGMA